MGKVRTHGGYRGLRGFQVAEIIYDGTVSFCARFMDRRSRTVDQMEQAARSGRQNIGEGSRASSSHSELKLMNVARGSLEELLLDYEDFLRQRRLRCWRKDDPEAREVRAVGKSEDRTFRDYARWLEDRNPEVVANTLICLIHQANYLLDRLIRALERDFIEAGGYSERLAAARLAWRSQKNQSDRTDPTDRSDDPTCPACAKPMILRTARRGRNAGSQFWGCSAFPNCTATLPL